MNRGGRGIFRCIHKLRTMPRSPPLPAQTRPYRPGSRSTAAVLVHLRVDTTFADVPRPDLLLVPGGPIASQYAADGHPIVDWIRQAHPHTAWTTSVCTGALLLGAAGLLNGVPATTHWSAYDDLASYGAQPTEQRVVTSGRIVTGAGVSAGIDLALTLAANFAGPEVAQGIQLAIEYDPQPPFDAGAPSKAPKSVYDLASAALANP